MLDRLGPSKELSRRELPDYIVPAGWLCKGSALEHACYCLVDPRGSEVDAADHFDDCEDISYVSASQL